MSTNRPLIDINRKYLQKPIVPKYVKNVCAKLHLQLVYMNTIMSSFVLTILSNAIYDLIEIKTCEMINVSQTCFMEQEIDLLIGKHSERGGSWWSLSNVIYGLIEIKTCEMINVSQMCFILLSASSIRY